MRRCIAISATVMFLAQVSYARLSGEQTFTDSYLAGNIGIDVLKFRS